MTTRTAPKVSETVSAPSDVPAVSRFSMGRLLVSLGLVGMMTATAALAWPTAPSGPEPARPVEAPVVVADVTASDVTVVRTTYEPGQSSGWHTHPGIHAVAVLSGSLTVYGGNCAPKTYGPGDSYVGGQELHVTRNETVTPVELVVTSVDTAVRANSVTPHEAPTGCDVR